MNQEAIQLYTMLSHLGRQIHRFSHKAEHEQGHFHGQINLLRKIAQNDGIVQRDLAELLDMRPSSMTEILGKMEQRSLILRRQDEKDQRLIHVSLTDAGREAVENAAQSEADFANTLFKGLSEEEIQNMLAAAADLHSCLEALNAEGPEDSEAGCGRHRHHHHREEETDGYQFVE